ncbi:MAG: ABC transporter ATP-binding protein [Acidobacteria bacterium]|nr:ABC transporter ATP-binding protein [Acidobacteriota bacterium]
MSNAWREAKDLLWLHRKRLLLGFFLMLINRLVGLVLPASSKFLIDEVLIKNQVHMLNWIALFAAIATIIQAITSFALSQILGVAAQRAITDMRKQVQQHVAQLPVNFFDSTQTGKLVSRIMSDADGIRNLVGTGLVQLVGSILTACLAVGILFYLNWKLTTLTILALACFGSALAYAFSKLRPLFKERGEINAQLTGRLSESLGGIRIIKAYTAEKREALTFAKGAHKLFRNVAKSMTGVSATTSFSSIIVGVIGVIMVIVGGNSVLSGSMTLGDFFMYIFFTGLMAMPVIEIAAIGTQITEGFAGLDRIRDILNQPTEKDQDASRQKVTNVLGDVEFKNVNFAYEEGIPILKNISFKSHQGSTTALVGSSGAGKSTLISLIMNFNQPQSGSLTIDGKELSSLRMKDYRQYLGVVLQDNFLFDGTVAENISFSKPNAKREEIEAVSNIAHCAEFIDSFEKKYDTIVGERGVKLSGGQRQRIAIARAILANPRILILDEATSSLDSESEALIQSALGSLRQGRTTFVIAHRLSTIVSADQILVLENGEIVERGTHQELLELKGRYKQLYDKQYQLEVNRFTNPGEESSLEMPRQYSIAR